MVNALALSESLETTLASMEQALESKLASLDKEHAYPSPVGVANKMKEMALDEAVTKVKRLPPAVTDAMKITQPHLHRHHHRHHDDAQLLQQQEAMKKKGIEEALDKAKETLSNMMEETETELDEAIMSCKEY